MEIVIDIPDRIHFGIEKGFCANGSVASQIVLDAVKNGTPLPKGHGRLIYAKDVGEYLTLADVPTIIEADKAESRE